MTCDLHTHSTASDGQYRPAELAELAGRRGIELLALTDHDTLEGYAEAARAGAKLGLRVLPGIELSAREYPTFHVLGYGFRAGDPGLEGLCRRMKDARDRRKYKILSMLRGHGIDLTLEEVEAMAGGNLIGRPHFAAVMVRRGYVRDMQEAFGRYLDTEEYHALAVGDRPAVGECIETIRAAGGHPSLAHPYQIGLGDAELEATVKTLADKGLEAIECRYPRHTPEMEEKYLRMARKYGLHVTGGSDFHGEKVKPDIELAALELDANWLLEG